jgi:hypothetical protein
MAGTQLQRHDGQLEIGYMRLNSGVCWIRTAIRDSNNYKYIIHSQRRKSTNGAYPDRQRERWKYDADIRFIVASLQASQYLC